MKRKLALFLAICLLATLCTTPVFAVSPAKTLPYPEGSMVTYLDDGITLVTSAAQVDRKLRSTDITAKKTLNCYDENNQLLCRLEVYADFRYDGTSAQYLRAHYGFTAFDSAWSLDEPVTYGTSGSTATGTATGVFVKKVLGIPVKKSRATVTVYCNANGNVW